MVTEVITKDTMASMIVCFKSLEEEPQPFRGQGNVNLVIPFNEYIDFISEYDQLSKYLLSGKFMNVSELINTQKKTNGSDIEAQLYKAYLLDMAVAVGKELWYSDSILHVVSTQISNQMPVGKKVSKEEIISYGLNETGNKIVSNFMEEMGYERLNNVSNRNLFQKYYIGMLVREAFQMNPWSFSI